MDAELDSVDKVIQGNTSNIVFLKSTDDSMLDTLQKMSGTTHKSFIDTKNITVDKQRLFMQNESKLSYTMTTKEVPVIMYNDMAFIAERNSIVFRAGDAPVWNRNQTILPMSWRLFQNTIVHAGHDYSLQTIPTLSSALDFDVRKNQPDFNKMLEKRMAQAKQSKAVQELYQEAYAFSDAEIAQMDPDVWANEIMAIIDEKLARDQRVKSGETDDDSGYDEHLMPSYSAASAQVNKEQLQANAAAKQQQQARQSKIYAGGMLSRDELVSYAGINHQMDDILKQAFVAVKDYMLRDRTYFMDKGDGTLYGSDGTPYIIQVKTSEDLDKLNQLKNDKNSNVFAEANINKDDVSAIGSYQVTDAFYHFLVKLDRWRFAEGRFDIQMKMLLNQ